jgi:hypothetical protein
MVLLFNRLSYFDAGVKKTDLIVNTISFVKQ